MAETEPIEEIETPEVAPPEEKTLVNIVDKISEEKQKEIAHKICEQYITDIDSRKEWEEKRDRWYKLWACIREPKNEPWQNASNVCIPILAAATSQFHARSYQSIFAPPGMVKTIPVGENDLNRSKNVEKFLNWQTMYEMEEYEEVFDKLLQLLPINGTAFKKLYYDGELERPVSEYISALDLVVPYRTKSLETARRLTHRLWLHYDELLDRNEMGLYSNFDKVHETRGKKDEPNLRRTADEVDGMQVTKVEEEPHLILECHKKYDLGDSRKPYIFTVDDDSETLLRVTSREFESGGETKTLNYFIDYHFIPNPEGFYSFGFGHFLESLNEMANTAFNQIFDAGRLSNQPFGFYGRRAGLKKKKIKLQPGTMTEVEDASQIYFPSMQRVDQVLFMILGLIQQYIEQFTSTSDYLSGRESKGTKTPTAHGTLAIIEQGLVTFAVMTKRIFRSLRKELRLTMKLNQIHLPESKQYRVMEAEANIPFPNIKKADFDGVYDLIPIGDPSYASRLTRRQDAMQLYQILMPNPLFAGSPPDKEGNQATPPNIPAIHELTSTVIDAFDVKNKSILLPDLPERFITPLMENAMFMQGDYKAPLQGENHQEHIAAHAQFMQGEFYRDMQDDYKPLLNRHLQETQRVAMLDTAQRQQLGEQQGGRGAQGAPPPQRPQVR